MKSTPPEPEPDSKAFCLIPNTASSLPPQVHSPTETAPLRRSPRLSTPLPVISPLSDNADSKKRKRMKCMSITSSERSLQRSQRLSPAQIASVTGRSRSETGRCGLGKSRRSPRLLGSEVSMETVVLKEGRKNARKLPKSVGEGQDGKFTPEVESPRESSHSLILKENGGENGMIQECSNEKSSNTCSKFLDPYGSETCMFESTLQNGLSSFGNGDCTTCSLGTFDHEYWAFKKAEAKQVDTEEEPVQNRSRVFNEKVSSSSRISLPQENSSGEELSIPTSPRNLSLSNGSEIIKVKYNSNESWSPRALDLKQGVCTEPEAEPSILLSDLKLVPTMVCNSSRLGEKHLRRSPRLHTPTWNGINKITSTETVINITNKLSEKQLNQVEDFRADSNCTYLSDSFHPRPFKKVKITFENPKRGLLDEKFWTEPPEMTDSLNGFANGKIGNALIELPNGAKMSSPMMVGIEHYLKKKEPLFVEKEKNEQDIHVSLIGNPIPFDEAQEKWGWRYEMKSQRLKRKRPIIDDDDEDRVIWNVECHYSQAIVGECIFNLGDCAYIEGEGGQKHVGRLVEFFKTANGEDYFRVQWFYRAEDTVMKEEGSSHDKKRLFYSTVMNDNPLDCIISKVNVIQILPRQASKCHSISSSDLYYDMEYCVDYSTFRTMPTGNSSPRKDSPSLNLTECDKRSSNYVTSSASSQARLVLLDLFSGCGGMSTGLCLGAKVAGVDLEIRWALDNDRAASESLKLNHPDTHVRNEAAEDFLELLKEWEKLCKRYVVNGVERTHYSRSRTSTEPSKVEDPEDENDVPPREFEVSRFVDICYGDPENTGKHGLKLKVRWKGYDESEDTWEPIEGLSNCQDCIREFVRSGFESKILPLPGDVDVICGGPPCQGISGYNRFRNFNSPLEDDRNRQIIIFMDIVQFLKPKFVLMENVVDILRFGKGALARYALSRLIRLKYQARIGTIAAGCYGLPQFRLRAFLWGAHPNEKLPQFPLPTHDVIIRYWPPIEFGRNTVGYDEGQPRDVENAVVLQDAVSDLPHVTTHETREEMTYERPHETEFQRFIRSTRGEMAGSALNDSTLSEALLYDHRPYPLTEEDCARVSLIPKQKGANFRDLPGVVVGSDNVVRRDATNQQVLPSGKPLIPDFALTFEQGKSRRPYGRVWWDETVPTVLTVPALHSQAVLHPEQDRVLTIRECARLQGFPDYYRFCGTVKQRYRQVGNAVAVPVARALGYCLGLAYRNLSGDEPLMKLPPKFSLSTNLQLVESSLEKIE